MDSESSDGDRPSLHEEPASAITRNRTIDLDNPAATRSPGPIVRLLGTLVLVAGVILGLSGVGTWAMVQTSLADERITVADDAARFGGEGVNGPLTAYYEADISRSTPSRAPVARPTPSSTARTRPACPS